MQRLLLVASPRGLQVRFLTHALTSQHHRSV